MELWLCRSISRSGSLAASTAARGELPWASILQLQRGQPHGGRDHHHHQGTHLLPRHDLLNASRCDTSTLHSRRGLLPTDRASTARERICEGSPHLVCTVSTTRFNSADRRIYVFAALRGARRWLAGRGQLRLGFRPEQQHSLAACIKVVDGPKSKHVAQIDNIYFVKRIGASLREATADTVRINCPRTSSFCYRRLERLEANDFRKKKETD